VKNLTKEDNLYSKEEEYQNEVRSICRNFEKILKKFGNLFSYGYPYSGYPYNFGEKYGITQRRLFFNRLIHGGGSHYLVGTIHIFPEVQPIKVIIYINSSSQMEKAKEIEDFLRKHQYSVIIKRGYPNSYVEHNVEEISQDDVSHCLCDDSFVYTAGSGS